MFCMYDDEFVTLGLIVFLLGIVAIGVIGPALELPL